MLRLQENSPQTYLVILEIAVILKILLGFAAHAADNAPLKIVARSADTLTARFTLPPLQINEAENGTTVYFAGADWTLGCRKPAAACLHATHRHSCCRNAYRYRHSGTP